MEYCEKTLSDVINEKKLHKTPDRLWNLFRQVDINASTGRGKSCLKELHIMPRRIMFHTIKSPLTRFRTPVCSS
jgi:hypothetical protein